MVIIRHRYHMVVFVEFFDVLYQHGCLVVHHHHRHCRRRQNYLAGVAVVPVVAAGLVSFLAASTLDFLWLLWGL